ncbi:AaceriAFR221Cp [[Ashbya] aceris (nom. inval.)]|nr:AaceriAFR221Cp [[Ashbya] aceris (nom. inval.)]
MKSSRSSSDGGDLYGILDRPNIKQVQFGLGKRFKTWYGSAVYFAGDKRTLGYKAKNVAMCDRSIDESTDDGFWLDELFVCEYCFRYYDRADELAGHVGYCRYKLRAPGRIKYMSPEFTIRKVKGKKHELFCQCMCLFTKLFLDNKSVYFRMTSYEFYILYNTGGHEPLGFFSKDLYSYNRNNLACILVFPPYQRRSLGTLLIDFSYRLSRNEGLVSGPEFPLSPFGLIGYLKYWSFAIVWHLTEGELANLHKVSLNVISEVTGIRVSDVIMALKHLKCLTENNELLLPAIRRWAKELKVDRGFMVQEQYLLLND